MQRLMLKIGLPKWQWRPHDAKWWLLKWSTETLLKPRRHFFTNWRISTNVSSILLFTAVYLLEFTIVFVTLEIYTSACQRHYYRAKWCGWYAMLKANSAVDFRCTMSLFSIVRHPCTDIRNLYANGVKVFCWVVILVSLHKFPLPLYLSVEHRKRVYDTLPSYIVLENCTLWWDCRWHR